MSGQTKNLNSKIVLFSILLNSIYVILQDTSSLHGLLIPNIKILILVLLPSLIYLNIKILQKKDQDHFTTLQLGINLTVVLTILKIFDYTASTTIYQVLLIVASILIVIPLIKSNVSQIRPLVIMLSITILIYSLNRVQLTSYVAYIGPVLEIAIVLGIIIFISNSLPNKFEIGAVGVAGIIGYLVGSLTLNSDIVPLILRTIFLQVLGLSQYTISLFSISLYIDTEAIYLLHFIEIFSMATFLFIRKKSAIIWSIILSGLDISFPPLVAFRSYALYLYLETKEKAS